MRKSLTVLTFGAMLLWAGGARADEARAIVEKAVKAHGGEEFLTKHKAGQVTTKGKLELLGGLEFTQEATFSMPDKFKEVMNMEVMGQKVQVISVFNGEKASIEANGKAIEITDDIKAALKEAGHAMKVARLVPILKEKEFELSGLGEVEVEGKKAVGVRVSSKGHKDVNLFFDKKSGLLVKTESRTVDPTSGQEVAEERIILEYDTSGKAPYGKRVMVKRDGAKFAEVEVISAKQLESIDDNEFAVP
jgi:hypothetical protein